MRGSGKSRTSLIVVREYALDERHRDRIVEALLRLILNEGRVGGGESNRGAAEGSRPESSGIGPVVGVRLPPNSLGRAGTRPTAPQGDYRGTSPLGT